MLCEQVVSIEAGLCLPAGWNLAAQTRLVSNPFGGSTNLDTTAFFSRKIRLWEISVSS